MTADELKKARLSLGLNVAELAVMLQTPHRTVQDWLAGKSRIPGVAAVAVALLQEKDKWLMQKIRLNTAARIHRDFPQGIPSAPIEDDSEDMASAV